MVVSVSSWGVPPVIIHFNPFDSISMGFSTINHPAIGYPHSWKPPNVWVILTVSFGRTWWRSVSEPWPCQSLSQPQKPSRRCTCQFLLVIDAWQKHIYILNHINMWVCTIVSYFILNLMFLLAFVDGPLFSRISSVSFYTLPQCTAHQAPGYNGPRYTKALRLAAAVDAQLSGWKLLMVTIIVTVIVTIGISNRYMSN